VDDDIMRQITVADSLILFGLFVWYSLINPYLGLQYAALFAKFRCNARLIIMSVVAAKADLVVVMATERKTGSLQC